MNVVLFGATGMVGDGVLHECLLDARVASVLVITRSPLAYSHPKLREHRRTDFYDLADLAPELAGSDACFFCLGVSALGRSESGYRRVTFDITLAVATALADVRPNTTFCYVSGEGTDSSTRGRAMWARVKGETENALLQLPLEAYMFRPGFIRPRPGARAGTPLYRMIYAILRPLYPVLRRVAPEHVTTAENIGRAMIATARDGYSNRILENEHINALGGRVDG
jgi:uncharacterized protein YbjT (DUF2867 family)